MTDRITDANALVDRVTELVSLPDVYLRVQQLLADPDSSLSDIGKVISSDPGIAARLLRIANSPFFGMASRIETISRAIGIMGTQHVHDFLLATAVTKAFSRLQNQRFDLARFWTRSVRCAVVTRLIAIDSRVLESERLFVAGLLHDIGHLVMYQLAPDQTAEAQACAEAQDRPPEQIERELFFGFDYAEVGGLLLERWQLPAMLRETVMHQNEPEQANRFSFETCILHAGRMISQRMEKPGKLDDVLTRISPTALGQTGISTDNLSSLETKTQRQLAETVALLVPGERLAS